MIDKIKRMSIYGDQPWRRNVPRLSDGSPDAAKGTLATAEMVFEAIEKLNADLATDIRAATERYSKKALPSERRKIAAAATDKLTSFVRSRQAVQHHADALLTHILPGTGPDLEPSALALREAEIRARLLAMIPDEATVKITGNDGEQRWIVDMYMQAVAAGDHVLVSAIENTPASVFPEAMTLTKGELTGLRIEAGKMAKPETASALIDHQAALADLDTAASLVEETVRAVLRENPEPTAPVDDPIQRLARGEAA